jgi:adenylate cyclase
MAWLVLQVADVVLNNVVAPGWIFHVLLLFLGIGFLFAMFFAWAFELTPEGIKREKEVDRSSSITSVTGQKLNNAIIGVLVVALAYFAFDKLVLTSVRNTALVESTTQALSDQAAAEPEPSKQPDNSIAVMPFINMSDDASNEFFSDGITEEVLNLLAKIPELRVTSRSSVFSLKGQNLDIPTVAKQLNVAHILEGSVRKAGNRVRVTAQLIEANSDIHMWSETFDRELDDIFAIQDEIAAEVVRVLQIEILGEAPVTRETDTAAYTAYLQGNHFFELSSDAGHAAARDAFKQAIDIDPEYAPAWAGLSRSLRALANGGAIDLHEGTEEARRAIHKALELDDSLAEAWASLARIQYVYDWHWLEAEGTVRTALMYGPNNVYALEAACDVFEAMGNHELALEYARKAVEVDPLNANMLLNLGATTFRAGQFEQAEKIFRKILDLHPNHNNAWAWLAFSLVLQDKPEEALQVSVNEVDSNLRMMANATIYHRLGNDEESQKAIRYLIENSSEFLAFQIAVVYAIMGDADKTFEWLETSFEQRDGGITHMLAVQVFEPFYQDPRWQPFLLKVGLLDHWEKLQSRQEETEA